MKLHLPTSLRAALLALPAAAASLSTTLALGGAFAVAVCSQAWAATSHIFTTSTFPGDETNTANYDISVSGSQTMTLNGNATVNSLTGNGTLTVEGGSYTLSITAPNATALKNLTISSGTVDFQGGAGGEKGFVNGTITVGGGAKLILSKSAAAVNSLGWGSAGTAVNELKLLAGTAEKSTELQVAHRNLMKGTLTLGGYTNISECASSATDVGFEFYGGKISVSGVNNIVNTNIFERGALTITVNQGGELKLAKGITQSTANTTDTGGTTIKGGGKLIISAASAMSRSGGVSLEAGSLTFDHTGATSTLNKLTVAAGAALEVTTGSTLSITGSLTLDRTSTLTNQGTIALGSGATLRLAEEYAAGDSFTVGTLTGFNVTSSLAGLEGRQSATYADGTITISEEKHGLTWAGSEDSHLWAAGSQNWSVTDETGKSIEGINGFQNLDSVIFDSSDDVYKTVSLSGDHLIAGSVSITGDDYVFETADDVTLSTHSFSGGFTKTGAGKLTLDLLKAATATDTAAIGAIAINDGSLQLESTVNGEGAPTIKALTGAEERSFTKSGDGALTISDVSGYKGGLSLQGGTLTLNGSTTLSSLAIAGSASEQAPTTLVVNDNVGADSGNRGLDGQHVAIQVAEGATLTEAKVIWNLANASTLSVSGGGVYAINALRLSTGDGNNNNSEINKSQVKVAADTILHITGSTTSTTVAETSFVLGNWNRPNVVTIEGMLVSNAGILNVAAPNASIDIKSGGTLALKAGIYHLGSSNSVITVRDGGTLAVANKTASGGTQASKLSVKLQDGSTVKAWVQNDTDDSAEEGGVDHRYLGDATGTVSVDYTFTFEGSPTVTFEAGAGQKLNLTTSLAGAGGIVATGGGDVAFTNTATSFTGSIAVEGGSSLTLNSSAALTGSLNIASEGTLTIGAGMLDLSGVIASTATIDGSTPTFSNEGTIVLGAGSLLKLANDLAANSSYKVGNLTLTEDDKSSLLSHIVGLSSRHEDSFSYDKATGVITVGENLKEFILTWGGTTTGTWENNPQGTTGGSWSAVGATDITHFANGDAVIFGETEAETTITISGKVSPDDYTDGGTAKDGIQVNGTYVFAAGSEGDGIAGGAGMSIGESGNLTLATDNSKWEGEVHLNGGTLHLAHTNALGQAGVTFHSTLGGTLSVDTAGALNRELELSNGGTLVLGSSGALGDAAAITVNGGTIKYGSDSVKNDISANLRGTGKMTLDLNGTATTWSTDLNTREELLVTSSSEGKGGSLTLKGAGNSQPDKLTIENGTVVAQLGTGGALAKTVTVGTESEESKASLNVAADASVGALAGNGRGVVTVSENSTLTINGKAAETEPADYAGTIAGQGNILVADGALLNLRGSSEKNLNTSTGIMMVQGTGQVNIKNGDTIVATLTATDTATGTDTEGGTEAIAATPGAMQGAAITATQLGKQEASPQAVLNAATLTVYGDYTVSDLALTGNSAIIGIDGSSITLSNIMITSDSAVMARDSVSATLSGANVLEFALGSVPTPLALEVGDDGGLQTGGTVQSYETSQLYGLTLVNDGNTTLTFTTMQKLDYTQNASFTFVGLEGLSTANFIKGDGFEGYTNGFVINGNTVTFIGSATASIPEPATVTLSLLALAGLAARRRRK